MPACEVNNPPSRFIPKPCGGDPPVLLLHGWPQTAQMWHRIAPRLAEQYTVVCPDLRG